MSAHLWNGKLNIGQLAECSRNKLLHLLEKCEGDKAVVWDDKLAGPVGLVIDYKILQENGVGKMYLLSHEHMVIADVKNIIFIVRANLNLMDALADRVLKLCADDKSKRTRRDYHLFFVPRKSLLCIRKLENSGVFGHFTLVDEFICDLYPFDSDLISMELESAFKDYYLDNDPTCLFQTAQAIMTLQDEYGVIPKVSGKGTAAKSVWDLVKKLTREQTNKGDSKSHGKHSQIDHLLLLDRSIDLLSPLATQLTYEGLIDEFFGINNTTAHFPIDKFPKSDDTEGLTPTIEKKTVILNSGDDLFADIRDKNFNAVGPALSKKAKTMSIQFEERHGKTIQEIKQFVERLPQLQAAKNSLAIHTTIAELIKGKTDSTDFLDSLQIEQELINAVDTEGVNSFIQDCIACKKPLLQVLRLLCIQSFVNSGLRTKVLEQYKRDIIQTYGLEHILTLNNLERAGLIRTQHGSRSYVVLRKTFQLTVEDCNELEPTDISYVHSIYAPITVRLAQHLVKPGGWRNVQDVLGLLPGPTVDETQIVPGGLTRRGSKTSFSSQSQLDQPRLVLVFFIGGCTFAEISALRFLSQQEDSNVDFVIATTKLINGNSFIKSLMEPTSPLVK